MGRSISKAEEELERQAEGIPTGYYDMKGKPICVGDNVCYYKKCTAFVGHDEIECYPKEQIVGTGYEGFVYTGKIMRQKHKVTFSFENGFRILDGHKYKYLYETNSKEWLTTILVYEGEPPKYTFDELIKMQGE